MGFATSRIQLDNQGQKGAKNIIADHLSRRTNKWSIDTISINDSFPHEFLFFIHKMPWYINVVNYLLTSEMPSN